MKVSLDGGKTYKSANNIRVIYDDVLVGDREAAGELHVNCTEEGVIMDVWSDDAVEGTSSETSQEIVERLA